MEDTCAAQIYVGDTIISNGSGFALAANRILTAKHILDGLPIDSWVDIRLWGDHEGDRRWLHAQVFWYDSDFDVALLKLDEQEIKQSPTLTKLENNNKSLTIISQLPNTGDFEFLSFGWPKVMKIKKGEEEERPPLAIKGTATLRGRESNDPIKMTVTSLTPKRENEWMGVSGATVFYKNAIVGVVINADIRFNQSVLDVMPLSVFKDTSSFWRQFPNINIKEQLLVPPDTNEHHEDQLAKRSSDIPIEVPYFVDRKNFEKQLIAALTSASPPRRVNLTGMGGSGKTTLANHVIRLLMKNDHFPDGYYHQDLHSLSDNSVTVENILTSLIRKFSNVNPIRNNKDDLRDDWLRLTDGKKFLLFLDDADDHSAVKFILPTTATCTVLVASRSVLPLPNLLLYRVSLKPMLPKEAQQLILSIANRNNRRIKNNQASIIAIECEYLPEAITIAATNILIQDALDVDMFIDELKNEKKRLNLLKTENASVVASLNLSLRRLSKEHVQLWQSLSIFAGSFLESAASFLWSAPLADTNRVLSQFEKDSLLTIVHKNPRRYKLHRLLRDIALDKLEKESELYAACRLLHAEYYLNSLLESEKLYFTDYLTATKILDADYADILFALDWLREHAKDNCRTAVAAINYPLAGPLSLSAVLNLKETATLRMISWLDAALEAIQYYRTHCLEPESGFSIRDIDQRWAKLMNNRGECRQRLGHYKEAVEDYLRALQVAENIDDKETQQIVLGNLGASYQYLADMNNAITYLQDAIKIAHELKDVINESKWSSNLGIILENTGKINDALTIYQKSLETAEKSQDRTSQAYILNGIGHCHSALKQFDEAEKDYIKALKIVDKLKDSWGQATILDSRSRTLIDAGNYEAAITFSKKGLDIAKKMQHPQLLAENLSALALSQLLLGNKQIALENSLAATQYAGADNKHMIWTLVGIIHLTCNDFIESAKAFEIAWKEAESFLHTFPSHCEAEVSHRLCTIGLSLLRRSVMNNSSQEKPYFNTKKSIVILPPAVEQRLQTLIALIKEFSPAKEDPLIF